MRNDYLWDRSGPPDPDVQHLEQLLGGMRYQRPLALAKPSPIWRNAGAVAAAIAVIAIAVRLLGPVPSASWQVQIVENGRESVPAKLFAGQTVDTGAAAKATLTLANFAELRVAPNTRLQLVQSGRGRASMSLERGLVEATIYAPPGNFSIATPSATAVDLGCQYTLRVNESGDGLLQVSSGWVSFEWQGREVFIPAGAACRTTRAGGPGIPYFEDSPQPFHSALTGFEKSASPGGLDAILRTATAQDAFTLWHILPRVPVADRARILDRIVELIHPSSGISRGGVLALKPAAMDALWDMFGLDDTTEWRKWKRPYRWENPAE